jgi:uncharacterized protein YlxW (UPF0749 family)
MDDTINKILQIVPTRSELENYKMIATRKFENFETRIKVLEENNEELINKVNDYETKLQQYKQAKKDK